MNEHSLNAIELLYFSNIKEKDLHEKIKLTFFKKSLAYEKLPDSSYYVWLTYIHDEIIALKSSHPTKTPISKTLIAHISQIRAYLYNAYIILSSFNKKKLMRNNYANMEWKNIGGDYKDINNIPFKKVIEKTKDVVLYIETDIYIYNANLIWGNEIIKRVGEKGSKYLIDTVNFTENKSEKDSTIVSFIVSLLTSKFFPCDIFIEINHDIKLETMNIWI